MTASVRGPHARPAVTAAVLGCGPCRYPLNPASPRRPGAPELAAVRGPVTWSPVGSYEDIRLDVCEDGIAKVTICRPEVRNAFRPQTLIEISDALDDRPGRPRDRGDHPDRGGPGRVLLGR